MFRGKESSNRIELSRLVQDLLSFGVLGSLQLWGWGGGWMGWRVVGGWVEVGGCPQHTCTCTCMHTCTHTLTHVVNMIISCKWLLPLDFLGNPWEFPMMSYAHACACACMHARACACVWGAPSHHPPLTSTHPHPPGRPPESVKIQ